MPTTGSVTIAVTTMTPRPCHRPSACHRVVNLCSVAHDEHADSHATAYRESRFPMPTQLLATVLHEVLLASGVFCDVVSPHRSSICFPQTADLVLHWDALFLSIYLTWRLYKVCVCLAHVSRIPLYLPVSDVSYSYFQPCWSAERHLADVCGTWLVRPSAQLFTDGPIATVLEAGWAAESTIANHVERVKSHLETGRNILEHLGHAMYMSQLTTM